MKSGFFLVITILKYMKSKKIKPAKKVKKNEILTMESLLKEEGVEVSGLKKGQEVRGKITAIKAKGIFIDIGAKADAVVAGKEFEFIRDYANDLKIGDEIEVQIKSPENDKGQILASIRGAASGYGWNYYKEREKNEGEITVFGKELNKGGIVVIAPFGFYGFIPGSQIGTKYEVDAEKMINKKIKVKVLEIDQAKNRLVFSERMVSEPNKVNEETSAVEELKIDAEFEAEIMRVEAFGLFVKIALEKKDKEKLILEGLVHISEISWEKVEDLSQMFKSKDKIKVKLINKNDGRLQFSLKRMIEDPWHDIEKKYPKDGEFSGEVVKLASFGALVRLEAGIEGLIHISKLGNMELKEGEKVEVYIESIDVNKRKISLGVVVKNKSKVMYK